MLLFLLVSLRKHGSCIQARSYGGAVALPLRFVLAPPPLPPPRKKKFLKWSQILCEHTYISYYTERFNIFLKNIVFADHFDTLLDNVISSFFCISVIIFGLCRKRLPSKNSFATPLPKFYILATCLLAPWQALGYFILAYTARRHRHRKRRRQEGEGRGRGDPNVFQ